MEYFDSHAHYNDDRFKDNKDELIKEMYKNGITKLVCAGYSVESSIKAIEIAEQYNHVYAIVGISPNDIENFKESDIDIIEKIAKSEKVVAIGEIGLDYYWNKENKELQNYVFSKQIDLANKLNLPIVIHSRDAVMDTIDMIKNKNIVNKKGIFHCCQLNPEFIKEAVKAGYYISFSGNVTFKNAHAKEAIEVVPIDRILIETDSPYLSPEPFRGTTNTSNNVKLVAKKIAEVLGMPEEDVAKITYDNACRIFEIK